MVMLLSHFKWGGTTAAKILTQAFRKAENEERMQTVCFVMEISIALRFPCADYSDSTDRQLRATLWDRDLGAINSIDIILCVDPEQQGFHREVPPAPSNSFSLILSLFNEIHLIFVKTA